MTRENKLALVVGFGLVLFVGILVSDHYSEANRTESANLNDRAEASRPPRPFEDRLTPVRGAGRQPALPNDPMLANIPSGGGADAPDLGAPASRNDAAPTPIEPIGPRIQDPLAPESGVRVLTIQPAPTGGVPGRKPSSDRSYEVRAGETLYAIAKREYGDGNAWKALAAYNDLGNAEKLREGATLKLPDAAVLGLAAAGTGSSSTAGAPATTAPDRAVASATKNYTVQDGDTLVKIARKVLGSRGRWPEIHSLNRDRLDDPDKVVPGMVIRVPASGR